MPMPPRCACLVSTGRVLSSMSLYCLEMYAWRLYAWMMRMELKASLMYWLAEPYSSSLAVEALVANFIWRIMASISTGKVPARARAVAQGEGSRCGKRAASCWRQCMRVAPSLTRDDQRHLPVVHQRDDVAKHQR